MRWVSGGVGELSVPDGGGGGPTVHLHLLQDELRDEAPVLLL